MSNRMKAALAVAAVLVAAVGLAAGAFLMLRDSSEGPHEPRAAILDQLAFTDPNPAFTDHALDLLAQNGYATAYYSWEQVRVDAYRELATHGYDIVLLRSHSSGQLTTVDRATGERQKTQHVTIFTNEPYDEVHYPDEQRLAQLGRSSYARPDRPESYFSISRGFVEKRMRGRFDDATIILMGCGGVAASDMADAFFGRGAATFVGWDGEVTAEHTDRATSRLLEHLLTERMPVDEAVRATMDEIGPDPAFGSSLKTFTRGAGGESARAD